MEKFIQKAGKQLAKVRIKTDQFLREQIGGSRTNLILLILVVFVLVILIVSAALNFNSLLDYYKIYLGLLILMVLAVIWAAIFYESEIHLESDTHGLLYTGPAGLLQTYHIQGQQTHQWHVNLMFGTNGISELCGHWAYLRMWK